MQFRQGDVLIESVEKIPRKAKKLPRENGRVVLAHGEVTGHAHAIKDKRVELLSETGGRELCYLRVDCAEALLQHEEHSTVRLPVGKYRVTKQREYHPQELRYVAD